MMLEKYIVLISMAFIALAVVWHAETGRYQIVILPPSHTEYDEGSFIKFDTRTAQAIEYCDLYKGYCQKWELWRQQNDIDRKNEPTILDLIKEERKKVGAVK